MSLILRLAGALCLLSALFAAMTFVGIPVAAGLVVSSVVFLALATILDKVRETASRTASIEQTLHDVIRTTPTLLTTRPLAAPIAASPNAMTANDVRAFMDQLLETGILTIEERDLASTLWPKDKDFRTMAKRATALTPSEERASEAKRLAQYVRERAVPGVAL